MALSVAVVGGLASRRPIRCSKVRLVGGPRRRWRQRRCRSTPPCSISGMEWARRSAGLLYFPRSPLWARAMCSMAFLGLGADHGAAVRGRRAKVRRRAGRVGASRGFRPGCPAIARFPEYNTIGSLADPGDFCLPTGNKRPFASRTYSPRNERLGRGAGPVRQTRVNEMRMTFGVRRGCWLQPRLSLKAVPPPMVGDKPLVQVKAGTRGAAKVATDGRQAAGVPRYR